MYRIGYLRERKLPIDDGFFDAMRKLGWIEGQNFKIDSRYADNPSQLPTLASELVQLKVDLMMTEGTPATLAAKQGTKTIPIVFVVAYVSRVAVAMPPAGSAFSRIAKLVGGHLESPAVSQAAKLLNVQVLYIEMRSPESSGTFFASAREAGADAALIPNVASFGPHLRSIAAEATKSRMPSIGPDSAFAEADGLLSYGATSTQHWPRVAAQIDKILKGVKPGDLPVEQPTRFELAINLKTAKALGIAIPQSLLMRADEVVQ